MTLFAANFESPIGPMIMVSNGTAITGLYIEGQKHFPANTAPWQWVNVVPGLPPDTTWGLKRGLRGHREQAVPPFLAKDIPLFAETLSQLTEYFAGERRIFDLPLGPAGTPFQCQVWKELNAIPYGTTVTYSELARRVGRPNAARAVGAAVGRNPLTILVPCHRVLGQDGTLTGFAGGLDRKRSLLELESVNPVHGLFERIGE